MTAMALALACAPPIAIASMTLAWAIEAWRIGAPGIAAGFAFGGALFTYVMIEAILKGA